MADHLKYEEKYIARVDGEIVSIVNPHLVILRSISDSALSEIVVRHIKRHHIVEEAKSVNLTGNVHRIIHLYDDFMTNEACLQQLWGFDVNSDYIRWWNFPHCICPKLDNEDNYGTPHSIKNVNCAIHGNDRSV